MTDETILSAIGSTEASTFKEFCGALGRDCPVGRSEWAILFKALRKLEHQGMLVIEREATGNDIESLQLTDAGANRIRDRKDAERSLLQHMK